MKRSFGYIEIVFDVIFLTTAYTIGTVLISTSFVYNNRLVAGIAALTLAFGDSFHLIPRILSILFDNKTRYHKALSRGKQISSITMTVFYILLWHLGMILYQRIYQRTSVIFTIIIYILGLVRIILCLMPQNKWEEKEPPLKWGIYRNIPFLIMGIIVAVPYFKMFEPFDPRYSMWIAIAVSFVFYLPVVLFAKKFPKVGALMIPKTCAYIWMLTMFFSLTI